MQATGKQFVEFWSWAAQKGLMNENTAYSFASPVRQIISVNDGWETMDISSMDVDELFRRFKNVRGKDFKPDSLNKYFRRFKQALDIYLQYVKDPTNWKYKGQANTGRKPRAAKIEKQRESTESVAEVSVSQAGSTTPMMDYPFPLRDNCFARLRLPADLKIAEVERLAAFMKTLAVDSAQSQS